MINIARHGPGRSARGFTLIEVLIALGIFLGAMMAILGLYFQNLRLARMAREEIILSMIQRDVMARNLVVSSARAGHERSYVRGVAATKAPTFSEFGLAGDGHPTYGGANNNPDLVLTYGWGIRNIAAWEASSGLYWGRFVPQGTLGCNSGSPLVTCSAAEFKLFWAGSFITIEGTQYKIAAVNSNSQLLLDSNYSGATNAAVKLWHAADVPLYEGFYFRIEPAARDLPDSPTASDWTPKGTTPGLNVEDAQFTDFDGYSFSNKSSWMDMRGEGLPDTDRGMPFPSPGPLLDNTLNPALYAESPYRFYYNSNKMSKYFMRLKVRVVWNVRKEGDIYWVWDKGLGDYRPPANVKEYDVELKNREDAKERVFSHNEYCFSVFNPDLVKRWQMP